jgi:predicted RND superfamily exporter protein
MSCIICSTPLKIKGLIMSSLLVLTAISTTVLSFTTNCQQVAQTSGNSTQTIENISVANKAVSVSLVVFSIASALFERHANKIIDKFSEENQELKSKISSLSEKNSTDRNEITNEPYNDGYDTSKSSETSYPTIIKIHNTNEDNFAWYNNKH